MCFALLWIIFYGWLGQTQYKHHIHHRKYILSAYCKLLCCCQKFIEKVRLHYLYEDPIVVVMVMVCDLMFKHIDVDHPLDHPSSNVTSNDETNQKSMIGLQHLPVHLVAMRILYVGSWHGPRALISCTWPTSPKGLSLKGPGPTLMGKSMWPMNLTCIPDMLFLGTPAFHNKSLKEMPFHTLVNTPPAP